MSTKDDILEILDSVNRKGMPELMEWLEKGCDFFTAPGSTKYHGNYQGGLADHSLNVFDSLSFLCAEYAEVKIDPDSIAIVGLLHDLCKINYYVEDDAPATSAQIKYMKDLIGRSGEAEVVSESEQTKAYVGKIIDRYLNTPNDPFPAFSRAYKVKDEFPMGHGEKSLSIVQRFMPDIKIDEALAIRWHLGAFEPGFHFHYPTGVAAQQAINEYPLVSLTISADFLASRLVDLPPK